MIDFQDLTFFIYEYYVYLCINKILTIKNRKL